MGAEPFIGIDLGTTNSVLATVQDGKPLVIASRQGVRLTPSIVAYTTGGERLVGKLAKAQAIDNPANTAYAVKRFIGRRWSSPEVQTAAKFLPYTIAEGQRDQVRVILGGRPYAVPEIAAMVLTEIKLDAEAHFGQPVKKAVITVPAYFNDAQRQATKDAGEVAGLEVLRIINEPTAAALAYGFDKSFVGKVLVFDLGGGTFDVSILDVQAGVFNVLSTGGDTYLGGEDFDVRIVDWLVDAALKENQVDLRPDNAAIMRLKEAAERAKCELSAAEQTQIAIPLRPGQGGETALSMVKTLTRAQFDEMTSELCDRCLAICDKVLRESHLRAEQLNQVILVGGMTRMPKIREMVRTYFGREPNSSVDPDEVVAMGASLQAAALAGRQVKDVLLLDVTAHSLGVAVAGKYKQTLIHRNSSIPAKASGLFATTRSGQTTVKITVLQGESEDASQNDVLGTVTLAGLRSALRGEVGIEVSFEIGADGILSVSATDKETGRAQTATLTPSSGLSQKELKRMKGEQAEYMVTAKLDEALKEQRSNLAARLQEANDLLPEVSKAAVSLEHGAEALSKAQNTLQAAQKELEGKNIATIAESAEAVERTLQTFRGILKQQAPQDPGSASGPQA